MAKRYKRPKRGLRFYKTKAAYKIYSEKYDKRAEVLAKHGFAMHSNKLDLKGYKTMIARRYNTLKEDVKQGRRKRLGNVMDSLISKQAYEMSEQQGYAIFDFLKKHAEDYDIDLSFIKNINKALMLIRSGQWLEEEVGLWQMIRDYREELKEKLGDTKESAFKIAQSVAVTFYGSDPDDFEKKYYSGKTRR